MIHTVKGFDIVNKAEVDVSMELSCFFYDPTDVGNLISGSSAFSKPSMHIWKFTVHIRRSLKKIPQTEETQASNRCSVKAPKSQGNSATVSSQESRLMHLRSQNTTPVDFTPQVDWTSGTGHLWYLFLLHSGRLPATSQLPSFGKSPSFGVSRVKNTLSVGATSTYFHSRILCPSESVAESHI